MRIVSLEATGFALLEPISLELDDGIYAITGENGSGKSTLLGLLGPMPLLLEVPAKTPSWLKDACGGEGTIDLVFESHDCEFFRASIEIKDGNTSSILSIYNEEKDEWEPRSTDKGRSYKAEIEKIIGPKAAYYASVYSCGEGGFEELSREKRRDLFVWYLGLEALGPKYDAIKKLANALPSPGEATAAEEMLESYKDDLCSLVGALAELITLRDAATEEARATRSDFEKCLAKNQAKVTASAHYKEQISKTLKEIKDFEIEIRSLESRIDVVMKLQLKLEKELVTGGVDAGDLDDQIEILQKKREEIREKVEKRKSEIHNRDEIKKNAAKAKRNCTNPSSAPCWNVESVDTDSCPFIQRSKEIWEEADSDEAFAAKIVIPPDCSAEETAILSQIAELKAEKQKYRSEEEKRKKIAKCRSEIALASTELDMIHVEWNKKETFLASYRAGLLSDEEIGKAQSEISRLRAADATAQERATSLVARVATLEERRLSTEGRIKEQQEKVLKIKELVKDSDAIQALKRACGPSGVPMHSIAEAAPEVSSIINTLLSAAYGDRFMYEIRTRKEIKSGEHRDTFDIVVFDSKRGGEAVEFGVLSKGEKAVAAEMFRAAFSIYQAMTQSVPTLAIYRDEPGSNLSENNNIRYVKMLRKAQEIGGFKQIFFATHSKEAAALADEVIHIEDGAIVRYSP